MRILVVGGTGGFGSQICRLLHQDGHAVVAGSRTRPSFVPDGMLHQAVDRDLVTPEDLAPYDLVVDAAGPFQGQSYHLVDAAIAAGVHHFDIADDRAYVEGIASRDEAARQAGIAVISGVSSVPALSSAAAIELAHGLDTVHRVDVSISAGAQAVFGRSVLAAMLSGAGRKIPWSKANQPVSMGSTRTIVAVSPRGDLRRQVMPCDAPDVTLTGPHLPGHPEVRFHAGSELRVHNLSMRVIAAMVSRGLIRSGTAFTSIAGIARRLTANRGSGRSAMVVEILGRRDGRHVSRTWSLVAENGSGPLIPCLTVPAMIRRLVAGAVQHGARSSIGMLTTDEILSRMPAADYDVTIDEKIVEPLYHQTMGDDWAHLAAPVQKMHDVVSDAVATGTADVRRGTGILAHLVCAVMRFPRNGIGVPVSVRFSVNDGTERWSRTFGKCSFSSSLKALPEGVEERFGPLRFRFRIEQVGGALRMVPNGWSLWAMPLPSALQPNGIASEFETDGLFSFDVPIRMPIVGDVVHYQGRLNMNTGRQFRT